MGILGEEKENRSLPAWGPQGGEEDPKDSSWTGETVETVMVDFIFLGSQITADGDCSHEIKRHLLLGRTAMTNLDSILKKQGHQFANKGPYSQSYVFFQ